MRCSSNACFKFAAFLSPESDCSSDGPSSHMPFWGKRLSSPSQSPYVRGETAQPHRTKTRNKKMTSHIPQWCRKIGEKHEHAENPPRLNCPPDRMNSQNGPKLQHDCPAPTNKEGRSVKAHRPSSGEDYGKHLEGSCNSERISSATAAWMSRCDTGPLAVAKRLSRASDG